MKALIFIPQVYSLAEMLHHGFESNGVEALSVDYMNLIPHSINWFYEKTSGLPDKITSFWKPSYFNLINKKYLELVENEKPDLILIYNNQFFFPETLERIKKKNCKITFLLGDNPIYSHTHDKNLTILQYSDYTISPDSHWRDVLSSIGMPHIEFDLLGFSEKHFYITSDIPDHIRQKYSANLLFIGRTYNDSSGYKRALFYNSFKDIGLKIFGTKEWLKWLPLFPGLEKNFILQANRVSHEELNMAINCAKIYPVDQNPGIINGIHLRVFETIGAGTLPIVEWRKDIDSIFGDKLPVIKNYGQANELIRYYLDNEAIRLKTINYLREFVQNQYTPALFIKRLLKYINL
jgi:hypothetical protein